MEPKLNKLKLKSNRNKHTIPIKVSHPTTHSLKLCRHSTYRLKVNIKNNRILMLLMFSKRGCKLMNNYLSCNAISNKKENIIYRLVQDHFQTTQHQIFD